MPLSHQGSETLGRTQFFSHSWKSTSKSMRIRLCCYWGIVIDSSSLLLQVIPRSCYIPCVCPLARISLLCICTPIFTRPIFSPHLQQLWLGVMMFSNASIHHNPRHNHNFLFHGQYHISEPRSPLPSKMSAQINMRTLTKTILLHITWSALNETSFYLKDLLPL